MYYVYAWYSYSTKSCEGLAVRYGGKYRGWCLWGCMAMETAVIDDIARFLDLDRDSLLEKGVETLLLERRRRVLLEKLQLLARYDASSKDEIEEKLKQGELKEHPTWEDLITIENLEAELEKLDGYIRSLQATTRSS